MFNSDKNIKNYNIVLYLLNKSITSSWAVEWMSLRVLNLNFFQEQFSFTSFFNDKLII
jgi:hypothetical protein